MMTHSPSIPKREWPAHAVPESWIDSLFAKLSAFYGSRFADAWRDTNLDEVREVWGLELRKLSPEQLRAGVHTLDTAFPYPPTLPQFMQHCRQARRASSGAQLTDQRRADPAQYAVNMEKVVQAAKPRAPSGVQWAIDLLKRGKSRSGSPLPAEVRRVAEGAVKNKRIGGNDD
jgi:hypothetical protein